MKKALFIVLVVLSSAITYAQQPIKNVLKAGAFIGSANVSYERVLDGNFSAAISPAFIIFTSKQIKYNIAGAGIEARYYLPFLKATAPRRLYISPGIGYYGGKASIDLNSGLSAKTDISGTSVKGTLGYQHIFKSRFVIDIQGGTQYLKLKFKGGTGIFINDEAFTGYLPYVGVGFGYAF